MGREVARDGVEIIAIVMVIGKVESNVSETGEMAQKIIAESRIVILKKRIR